MSLYRLIERIPDFIKTNQLLKPEITQMLRFSFLERENHILETKVLNDAILNYYGSKLVYDNLLRNQLLKYSEGKIRDMGYDSVDEYSSVIKNNLNIFFEDFQIEDKYHFVQNEDLRQSFEILKPSHNEIKKVSGFPHEYQKELKNKLSEFFFRNDGVSCIANMPTGGGKTILALEVLVDMIRNRKMISDKSNIIWIVDSSELAEQSFLSFAKMWNQKGDEPIVVHRFFSKFNQLNLNTDLFNVVFCTFSLITSRLGEDYINELFNSSLLLVIDECHASNAATYSNVIDRYKMTPQYRILGLTATPYRTDDDQFVALRNLFNLTFKINTFDDNLSPIAYLQEKGFLARIQFEQLTENSGAKRQFNYYNSLHLSIIEVCENLKRQNKNTIIFAESKSHAIALSILLKYNNFNNELIVGETPNVLRQQYLNDFADDKNDLNILVNHQILSTGIDVPGLNSIVVLSNIDSPTLALQILGRAMRGPENGGNAQNTIYLTEENYNKLKNYKLLEEIVLNN